MCSIFSFSDTSCIALFLFSVNKSESDKKHTLLYGDLLYLNYTKRMIKMKQVRKSGIIVII